MQSKLRRRNNNEDVADLIEAYLASPANVLQSMGYTDRAQNKTVLALAKEDLQNAIEILITLRT
jgi:hypothetical protein